MPYPSSNQATLRNDLGGTVEELDLAAERAGFIGTRFFRLTEVIAQAGDFGKIPIEQLLQNSDTKRAEGSGYLRGNFTFQELSYSCQEYGHEHAIDDREAKMYREFIDAERSATQICLNTVLRTLELRVRDLADDHTLFPTTTAVGTAWSNTASTPIADVETEQQAMYDATGLWPNVLVMNRIVFRNLRHNLEIRDRISSSGAGRPNSAADVTQEMLEKAFDLPILIADQGWTTSVNEGQGITFPDDFDSIWSSGRVYVARIATSDDFSEPCCGRTFHWSADGSRAGGRVETYRDEKRRCNVVRVRHELDELVLYPELLRKLTNITA